MRAALYRACAAPTQPRHSGRDGRKKADIPIEEGTVPYAVEVKRPEVERNATRLAREAAEQIAAMKVRGGMVVDLTHCLPITEPSCADAAVLRCARTIFNKCFTHDVGWKSGFEHIKVVAVIARPAWQTVSIGGAEEVVGHSTSWIATMGKRARSLDTLYADAIRAKVNRGLNSVGFTSQEAR